MADNQTEKQKVQDLTDKLERGLTELFNSDSYKNYLSTMSKFHNYSFNNTLLIAMQKPEASLVAGYNAWQKNFGRHVNKGEKAIRILAPVPYKIKEEREKVDPVTQEIMIDRDGNPQKEEVEITIPAFRAVSVFDVSQTDGKPIPELETKELLSDVDGYQDMIHAVEAVSPVPIEMEEIDSGAKGYFDREARRIAVQENMSESQTLKTMIHEVAHSKLHTKEVEAESIAYTVCQHFGVDTSEYSFGYIAGWSSGRDTKELKSSMDTIRRTAWCIDKKIREKSLQEIPFENVIKLLDILENTKVGITIEGGGEPTMYSKFNEFITECYKRNIQIGLITNGTMLVKKEMIECVAQTHTWIRIGLNAGTEDTYEKITHCNGENFTRILNSIRILKEKAEIEEFRVGLNFVITLDNYKEIIQATKLAREAEAHYIRFEPEFYSALAHETIYTKIEEINSMLEKAKKLQTKEFEVSIPKLNRGAMTNTDSVEGDFKVCHYCNFVTALGADGSMYPCPQIHLNEKYCMGNAINDGYSKWIQSKDKENWYRKNRDRTILCKTCFYRPQNELIECLVTGELELDEVLKKYQEDVPMTIHKEFV